MIDGYVVTDITLRTWEHASGIEWPMICFTSSSPKIANFRMCMHAAQFWEKVNLHEVDKDGKQAHHSR